jgi:hypothetical protein
MAEAIHHRAEQRGLSPSRFAEAAGLTEPGLKPVRDGVRKQYALKTRRGVAVALGWPLDWYDRLVAGDDWRSFPEAEHAATPASDRSRLAAVEQELTAIREALAVVVDRVEELARRQPPAGD